MGIMRCGRGAAGGSVEYPTKATCWHEESKVTVGNAIIRTTVTSQPYNVYNYQFTSANGDTFQQPILLAAGTYDFKRLGVTLVAGGVMDWYLDSTKIVSAESWYAGGTNYNVLKTTSGIVVATSGLHDIKGVVTGKGFPMGGGYDIQLTKFWFSL